MVALLNVEQLKYAYGNRVAVEQASLTVEHGRVFGLLGPNGAGKTTTISCIAGLLSNWTGAMHFDGQRFEPAKRLQDRKLLGYVPQELAVYENLTAAENLGFFAKITGVPAGERKAAVERNLELAGLESRRNDLVKTFSGGMKRRLNLAVGLLHNPKLILLDEPTVGVDPQSRNHLFDTLLRLKSEGHSLLYTTHYMEEAQKLCDTIAIMNEGRVVATGTAQELAEQAGTPDENLESVFLHLTGRKLRDD
jgi:ABC-2 type transport system ATP-binding protein